MERIACDKDWQFYEGEESNSYIFGCPKGERVDLPHDFIIGKPRDKNAPGGVSNGYFGNGQGVYRKTLEIPAEWEDSTVLLDVDGAYMNMEVSLNNEVLAMHPNGYIPYQVDLTPALRFDGRKNRLKIITQSRQPSSRWYCGGGLYRDVCLWVGGPIHIKPWDVFVSTPLVDKKLSVVKVETVITGTDKVRQVILVGSVLDKNKNIVGEIQKKVTICNQEKLDIEIMVEQPFLWDLEEPYLYTLELVIKEEDIILDTFRDTFGIRKIEIDTVNGFRLNGKKMKLKGGCIHHDNGFLGACAYPRAEERKIKILKAVGYNTVRISHYPPSLEMLKICDRLGMLVMDEAFDVWRLGKIPMDYHLYFETWWHKDIEYMVRRDRNHPCIITYSIGNEINEANGKNQGAVWSRKLADKVREFDSTRFVMAAICGVLPDVDDEELGGGGNFEANMQTENVNWNEITSEFCRPLDIVGYNYLKDLYEESHALFPDRIIIGAETHPFLTYDYWQKVKKLPYVIGDCIWVAVDYLGEVGVGKVFWENDDEPYDLRGPYPWRTSWQADIDLTGEQRPQSVYREIMWGNTQKSGLYTTHPKHFGESFKGSNWHWYDVNNNWSFEEQWIGKLVQVDVYGGGDIAEFILNGESLGKVGFEKLIASMNIPYHPGTLKAIIYKDGKAISQATLVTTGKGEEIELIPENQNVLADGKDLAYVRATIKDAEGRRLMYEEREIKIEVSDNGILLSAGSGNPCTEDYITANTCHLYRGTAILIVKAVKAGDIEITVSANGVKDGRCILSSKNVQSEEL